MIGSLNNSVPTPLNRHPARGPFAARQEAAHAWQSDTEEPGSSAPTEQPGTATRLKENPAARAELIEMAQRDREVREHEAAHLAAAGGLAIGGATLVYRQGPDGKLYAVGGEVRISLSPGRTPEETVAKARQIRTAALAPGNPSAQDLAVAAKASAMELAALRQLAQENAKSSPRDRTRPVATPDSGAGGEPGGRLRVDGFSAWA